MEPGCWVLGGEFEDSVFEQRPERRPERPAPYGAKLCEPQWFYGETESSDDMEVLTLKKFRGDLAYRRQEYEKALQEYSSISEQLPSTNFAMRRDVQEGQARCLAHLGRHREALEIAAKLENKATNVDHLTTVLYLHLAIFSSLQNLQKTILCLQKLISLHPLNPWNWWRLAEAYLSPGPGLPALSLPEKAVFPMAASGCNIQKAETDMQREASWMQARLKACACLIRARLLLQLTQSQQTSFALERNLRTQREIAEKVEKLGLPEGAKLWMEEAMGEDITPEKVKEDVRSEVKCVGPTALAALAVTSSTEFEDKWFGKLKDRFCPSEDEFHVETQIMA